MGTVDCVTEHRGPGGSAPDPSVRTRVLDAFVELVSERGLASTSMRDVAERAGVSKTTLYTRWPDRRSMIADGFAHVTTPVPDLGPEPTFRELLDAMVAPLVESDVSVVRRQVYVELLAAARFDPAIRAVADERRERWRAALERTIELGKATGEVPADRDTAVAAEVAMAVTLLYQLQAMPLGPDLQDLIRRLVIEPTPY